jgi:capsular exopolysaccharide synthesis family protein
LLNSDTLARRVAEGLGAASEDQWHRGRPELLGQVRKSLAFLLGPSRTASTEDAAQVGTQRVKEAITVRTSLQSQVIDLFFDAPDASLAARGANAVASEFINLNREARRSLVQDTTEWLNQQAAELKGKLETSNQKLQEFASRSRLVFEGNQNTPAQDRVRQLQDALTHAVADRAAKQARYEAVITNPAEIMSDGLASGPLRQYETDLQGLRRQLADLSTVYTPQSAKVTRVEAQIAEAKAGIEKEREAIIGQMHSEYVAAASLEHMLSQNLERALTNVEQQTEKVRQYDVLKNEVDTTQRLYNGVLEKTKDAGAASFLQMSNVRVIDSALPPKAPYSPNLPLNMAIGLGIGTVGGIGLVLLRVRSSKIQQPGELMLMHLPELGAVPSAKSSQELEALARVSASPGEWRGQPQASLLKESFRAVLTSILLSTGLDRGSTLRSNRPGGQVLVVSSLDMMEGKTTIVTNLGIASAEQRHDILLVDADLRRPRLHERFHLPNDYGLTNLLERSDPSERLGSSRLDALVQPTHIPHLWVLTSGPTDAASPDRLFSADLDALMQHFQRRFDFVFIDTPPMLMYSDARILGRMAEGLVMVVRANTRSREELRAAIQKLVQDRIRVIGAILNDWAIDPNRAHAYSRYYDHYQRSSSGR